MPVELHAFVKVQLYNPIFSFNALNRIMGLASFSGTLKLWPTQAAGHLRAKEVFLGPTGLITLPGEDWSSPGKRPRNSYISRKRQRKIWMDNVRKDLNSSFHSLRRFI